AYTITPSDTWKGPQHHLPWKYQDIVYLFMWMNETHHIRTKKTPRSLHSSNKNVKRKKPIQDLFLNLFDFERLILESVHPAPT
ncbi:MAG: hypothetical protein WCJ47_07550, partial [Methanomicrobiales archaeon]